MPFAPQDEVRSARDTALVGIVTSLGPVHNGLQYYVVFWGGAVGTRTVAEMDLRPNLAGGKPSLALQSGPILGYAEFQRLMTFQRLSRETPLRNNIYAFNASRTQFFPFQFKPLIKLLDSPDGRLLICDEVGLGKTIEAGLILIEERARREVRTALVICPSGLRTKWQEELRRRFDEKFVILNASMLRDFLSEYERDRERTELSGIVSLETVRAAGLLEQISEIEPSLDVVIVDEAHHLRNFGTASRQVAAALGRDAGTLVFLTATPVHLGTQNLYSLLNLLDEREFPDEATAEERFRQNEPIVSAQRFIAAGPQYAKDALAEVEKAATLSMVEGHPLLPRIRETLASVAAGPTPEAERRLLMQAQRDLAELNLLSHIFTRTRKRDAKTEVAVREAHAVSVSFTPEERTFYEAVSLLVQQARSRPTSSPTVMGWVLNNIQRRLASSIHAMVDFYKHHEIITQEARGDDEELDLLPPLENSQDIALLAHNVRALAEGWPANAHDSKYSHLKQLLEAQRDSRAGVKVLVFAFFKQTLRYLSRRLTADGITHVLIDGDVPGSEREQRIAMFRDDPRCQVMLSSRVGSEGLDFQFSDTLVNYDLTWNPMDVEQRIGRLDRIGQRAQKILIFNLWTVDTIEERILRRLYDRLGIFERAIGVLDPILGDEIQRIDKMLVDPMLSNDQREMEAERIAKVLEAKRQALEALEQQASSFVGVDAYFDEELEGVQKGRRYVTGDQLLRFLEDFLLHRAPRTRLRYDSTARRGVIVPDQELKRFIQAHHHAGALLRLMGAGEAGMPFTMDAKVAFEEPQLEFINLLHPLIEIIRTDYQDKLGGISSAQHVVLRTRLLRPAHYVFVVYRLRVNGVRPVHFLETVILNEALATACDRQLSEQIVGEMVELGEEPVGVATTLAADFAARAAGAAEQAFLDRLVGLREDFTLDNTSLVDRRAASVRFHLQRQLDRRQEQLERQVAEGKPESVLQLVRGKIKKLEGDLRRRMQELEAQRQIEVGYDEVAAGILEVLDG